MNPARVFCLLAMAAFAWSCMRYRRADVAGGDGLLFLAWCFMIIGYIDEFRRMLYGAL